MGGENPTCRWQSCTLPPEDIGIPWCILHDPEESKNAGTLNESQEGKIERFKQTLENKILREETDPEVEKIDLSGVVFPIEANFAGRFFNKDVNFAQAKFKGEAYFFKCRFSKATDFFRAEFTRLAGFRDAHFCGPAGFFYTHFNTSAYFINAEFRGGADFNNVVVGESLIFTGQTFLNTVSPYLVDFRGVSVESARRIRFEGVDLSRASFLRTNVSQVHFVDCAWPRKKEPRFWPIPLQGPTFLTRTRGAIYDETDQNPFPLVADLYRQLRINYESNRQEVEAGDFYIGQMEMRRQDESYSLFYRLLLSIYRVTGMYGESYVRPFTWYAFILAPLYALGYWLLSDLSFADGLFAALTAGFLFREVPEGIEDWEKLLVYFNMFTVIYLLGLTILALRRHFRR